MRTSTPTRGRPTEPSRVASRVLSVPGPVTSDMPHTSRMMMSMEAKKSSTSRPMGAAPTEKNSTCSKPMRSWSVREHQPAGELVLGLQRQGHLLVAQRERVVRGGHPARPAQHLLPQRRLRAEPLLRLRLELLPHPGHAEEEGGPHLLQVLPAPTRGSPRSTPAPPGSAGRRWRGPARRCATAAGTTASAWRPCRTGPPG